MGDQRLKLFGKSITPNATPPTSASVVIVRNTFSGVWIMGTLKGLPPKVAVVMIGTNNCNKYGCPIEEISEGMVAVAKKTAQRTP